VLWTVHTPCAVNAHTLHQSLKMLSETKTCQGNYTECGTEQVSLLLSERCHHSVCRGGVICSVAGRVRYRLLMCCIWWGLLVLWASAVSWTHCTNTCIVVILVSCLQLCHLVQWYVVPCKYTSCCKVHSPTNGLLLI